MTHPSNHRLGFSVFALIAIGMATAVGISPTACSMPSAPEGDAGEMEMEGGVDEGGEIETGDGDVGMEENGDEDEVTEILMQGIAFVPKEVTIRVGQRVRWTNRDALVHTTTSGNPGDADAGSIWRSGNLPDGESFTFQFDEQGEFVYFCETHPGIMRDAKVTVQP